MAPGESEFSILIDSVSANDTTYVDSFITTDTTYFYKVSGRSGKNDSPYSEAAEVVTVFPRPTDLITLQTSESEISLSWKDNSTFEEGFILERKSNEQDFETLIQLASNDTTFLDNGVSVNQSYSYRIKAFTTRNESEYTNSDGETVLFPSPSNLTTTLLPSAEVQLDWYDINPYEIGFSIERGTDSENFNQIASVSENVTTYIDYDVEDGNYYYYRVKAYAASIESDYSNIDSTWVGHTFMKYFGTGNNDGAQSVAQSMDGGFIVTGGTNGDILLLKTSLSGDEEWSRMFDINGSLDKGYSVQQTMDGGYIVTGTTRPTGSDEHDVLLIKTDSQGIEEWTRTFGQSDYGEGGYSVEQNSDGGFIVAGYANSLYYQEESADLWLIRTDPLGNEVWNSVFDGGYGFSVQQTIDSGYIITGSSHSSGPYPWDILLVKTDESGNEEWTLVCLMVKVSMIGVILSKNV